MKEISVGIFRLHAFIIDFTLKKKENEGKVSLLVSFWGGDRKVIAFPMGNIYTKVQIDTILCKRCP